ncbi:O-antigen ligase [Salinibacterium sp. ZJ70]|uniref:O-antigen ligase family protein n=1 Tax=Salinibacterium sp. ZJ70 TaxID=2708084 RepID=UPI00142200C1|nr:O-antigen ligase family protein [Salinibacterium sp. ZJ70]
MRTASRYQRTLAGLGFFSLAAGDLWRNLLGWWGWGAVIGALLALSIVELVRTRTDIRRVPLTLKVFLGLAVLSIAWSAYPGASAIGSLVTIATAAGALFFAACFTWDEILEVFSSAIRWVLGLSLLFELVVATIIRRPVLPLWVDYSDLEKIPMAFYWSRNLLFEGGRIQGVVGNANLLAMVALLGLIVFVARLLAHSGARGWGWFWIGAAVITLVLTGSATIIATAVVVAVAAVFVLIVRATSGRTRRAVIVGGVGLAVVGGAGVYLARDVLLSLLGRSPDLTNRLTIWETVAELAVQRPVAGWGWVSYWAPWVEPFENLLTIKGVTYLQAHNAWLDVFLQLGVIGVLVFGAFVLGAFLRSWGLAIETPHPRMGTVTLRWPLAIAPFLLMVALLVQSLAESRMLIELGFALLCLIAIKTGVRDSGTANGISERSRSARP